MCVHPRARANNFNQNDNINTALTPGEIERGKKEEFVRQARARATVNTRGNVGVEKQNIITTSRNVKYLLVPSFFSPLG